MEKSLEHFKGKSYTVLKKIDLRILNAFMYKDSIKDTMN